MAVGGNAWRRAQFAPMLIDVDHVSPCYPYRDQHQTESAELYGKRLAAELDAKIQAAGPRPVIAFVAGTVGGGTSGAPEC